MSLPNKALIKGAAHDVPFRNGCHQGKIIYGIFILSQARLCVPRREITKKSKKNRQKKSDTSVSMIPLLVPECDGEEEEEGLGWGNSMRLMFRN